jgi:uncharacterized membrane protein YdbT with pleckstrin-like domain
MEITGAEKVTFEGEWDDENVIILRRAHFIVNLPWLVSTVVALGVPFLVWAFFKFVPGIRISINHQTTLLLNSVWFLVVFFVAFQTFLNWYFNIYIITNKRLVDLDFFSVFFHKVSQATLDKVQDVEFEKKGILQNFFDYGDVQIETAGEISNFCFENIPNPEGYAKQVLQLASKIRSSGLGEAAYGLPTNTTKI